MVKVDAFDASDAPDHLRGITTIDGLSVLGLPWLYTCGSGRFAGIADDALHVADHIAARVSAAAARSAPAC
jgi:putative flavoprotein involved in K+ transport